MEHAACSDRAAQEGRSRVRIAYECGSEAGSVEVVLPAVVGVLADLSGDAAAGLAPVASRRFATLGTEDFDGFLRQVAPRLALDVPDLLTGRGTLAVDLVFEALDDFTPAGVARQVGALRAACERGGEAARAVGAQLQHVLHHEGFRRLEGTWRGLRFLLRGAGAGGDVRVRVLNVAKAELRRACEEFSGDRQDMEDRLNRWLSDYVRARRAELTPAESAERPLAFAQVRLGAPFEATAPYHAAHRYLAAELSVQPAHQLEGLTVPIRLPTRLPWPQPLA